MNRFDKHIHKLVQAELDLSLAVEHFLQPIRHNFNSEYTVVTSYLYSAAAIPLTSLITAIELLIPTFCHNVCIPPLCWNCVIARRRNVVGIHTAGCFVQAINRKPLSHGADAMKPRRRGVIVKGTKYDPHLLVCVDSARNLADMERGIISRKKTGRPPTWTT